MSSTSGERVLIVEDEPSTRLGLTELVRTWGFTTDSAGDGEEALQRITVFRPNIIISDLVMPRMGGLELLRALKDDGGDYTVVILTAQGTVETAVEAIKEGAYDYLNKPIEPQRLKILLDKIVERQDTLREVKVLRKQLREHGTFGKMIGSSPQMRKVYQVVEQAAPTSASVLIWGESGTGKELVAQTIHQLSSRGQMPFVPINCAAIPETLLESEIFGHEKGAFTGAHDRRTGVFELAHRGTLFLDEIAEMMPATQVKLLRVLQAREFERLGGTQSIQADIRLVAATNKDLEAAIVSKGFREDLFYRLNVFAIFIPPLRDRKTDVLQLANFFLEKFATQSGKNVKRIATPAIDMLMAYHWPGNVRELENAIERAVVVCNEQVLHAHHLPPTLQTAEETGTVIEQSLEQATEAFEKDILQDALKSARGNRAKAARLLKTTGRVFNYKVRKYGIDWKRFR